MNQRITKEELKAYLRTINLGDQPTIELAAWCQYLGISGRGAKCELIWRLIKELKR